MARQPFFPEPAAASPTPAPSTRRSGNGVTFAAGGTGTVTNFGTIETTTTSTVGEAIYLGNGGSIANSGLITGTPLPTTTSHSAAIITHSQYATVSNLGTISSTNDGDGINLDHGGTIVNGNTNTRGALITGSYLGIFAGGRTGTVYGTGAATRIVNYGTIQSTTTGTGGEAIVLESGGTIANYGLIKGTRIPVAGRYAGAVTSEYQSVSLLNLGTVSSTNNGNGVNLLHGGTISNGSTNAPGALITGSRAGIYAGGRAGVAYGIGAAARITNFGTIQSSGSSTGIRLVSGGTVTNEAGGSITAYNSGVSANYARINVFNYGSIGNTGSHSAVYLGDGGNVVNGSAGAPGATIRSNVRTGVAIEGAAGSVVNFGTIISTAPLSGTAGTGVYLQTGGKFTNQAGGVVTAYRNAVTLGGTVATRASATVTNFGTLFGNVGVGYKSLADIGTNTIVNYGTITGTSGVAVALGNGAETLVIEPGSVLSGAIRNLQPGDTIDLVDFAFDSAGTAVLGAGNLLTVTENHLTDDVQLDPNQLFVNAVFALSADGSGGTLIELSESFGAGQNLTVSNTAYTAGLNVPGGSEEIVELGGSAIATDLSGGALELQGGGTASALVVDSGGSADEFGSAFATIVNNGGAETIQSGGVASSTTVSGGGVEIVSAGGTASGTLLLAGSALTSGISLRGGSEISGHVGILSIAAEQLVYGTAISTIIDGGTVVLEIGGSLGSSAITFAGSGTLQILGSATPANVISGFAPGDLIDLPAVAYDSNGTLTLLSGNTLALSAGGKVYDFDFDPAQSFAGEQFGFAADSGGGTEIALTGASVGAGQVATIGAGQQGFGIDVLSGGIGVVFGTETGGSVGFAGQEYAESGGITSALTVLSGADEFIEAGGTASGSVDLGSQEIYGVAAGTVISAGGRIDLFSGGMTVATVVSNGVELVNGLARDTVDIAGGFDFVYGAAVGTILSGGEEYIEAGATASGTVANSGAQVVYGTAEETLLIGGGTAYFLAGSTASGITVSNGLAVIVGLATSTEVASGSFDFVEPGGAAVGTVLSGGDEFIEPGAVTTGTVVGNGATQVDYGVTSGTVINAGGFEYVYPGGTASGTVVNSGGVDNIFVGFAVGTVDNSGGKSFIYSGLASATIVAAGGAEFVEFGGTAVGTLVSGAGATQDVVAGAASGTTLASGGVQVVEAGEIADDTTVNTGGYEFVAAGGDAAGATISGGIVELSSAATGAVAFAAGAGGLLKLDDFAALLRDSRGLRPARPDRPPRCRVRPGHDIGLSGSWR